MLAVDMFGRDFADEAAGDAAHPLAIDAAVRGVIDARALAGAGDRDIGEAAFFLEAGGADFVHRTLRGENAVFPAGEETMIEFELSEECSVGKECVRKWTSRCAP